MPELDAPIIVGAGPVGLATALFLAIQRRAARVVEMRKEPSQQSKALAVNPRTLEILGRMGLADKLLEAGRPLRGVCFHRPGRKGDRLSFAGIHPRYPFMLALSQATSERLLAHALEAEGSEIERGVKLVECRPTSTGVEATLERVDGGTRENCGCPWLVAADGAHSTVRHLLNIDFAGASFKDHWHLADVPLRTRLDADHAHAFFFGRGAFVFLIRVINDERRPEPGYPTWRVIANRPDPLSNLHVAQAEQAGEPLWESSFAISHRLNSALVRDRVYFAGDAAHVHSPMGARGMNLGIEDAWVLARLASTGRLGDYERLRRPVDARVVRQVKILSKIASGESFLFRQVRRFVFPAAIKFPFIRRRMIQTVTGLDHELDA